MTEDEILQVSNDISENMLSPKVTKSQLVEVIRFFINESEQNWEKFIRLRCDFAMTATKLLIEHDLNKNA